MLKRIAAMMLLAVVVLTAVVGTAALRPVARPSGPIQAVPLDRASGSFTTSIEGSVATKVFQIQPAASQARFVIDEILRGSPKTVVGVTDQVSGEIAVNPTLPDEAQVGTILISARSLETDDSQRNRMLANLILGTAQFEYITFEPTEISGLPEAATMGTPYSFEIDGQLTIRDVTRPATFAATVTPVSPTQLEGTANTTIAYGDWGIAIPQVPAVAGVSETVALHIDFIATADA